MTPSNWYRDFMREYGVEVGSYKPSKKRYTGPLPTLGHYRNDHGIREFNVQCLNTVRCWHKAVLTFDDLPDDTVAKSLDERMVCMKCGYIGADVRPDWSKSRLMRNREQPTGGAALNRLFDTHNKRSGD